MQIALIVQLVVLLVIANGTPLIVKKLMGDYFAQPLDGGAVSADGRPLFGQAKTIRGVLASLAVTSICSAVMGLGWAVGALIAAGAMLGDLFSSLLKRRMGLPTSSMALGLDQIPESLFPLLAASLLIPLSIGEIAMGVIVFAVSALVLSRILFKLHLRDQPF